MRYLLLLLLFTGCSASYQVDPQLEPIVEKFRRIGYSVTGQPIKADDLIAQFTDSINYGDNAVGDCQVGGGAPTINILKPFWDTSDYTVHEIIMFHELGHCLLYRFHDLTVLKNGRPNSIMYPDVLPETWYLADYSRYTTELFKDSLYAE